MADETDLPPWFSVLRQDMAAMEVRITSAQDRMVTKDVFEAEQRYQAERHRMTEDRRKEDKARAEAAEKALGERIDETQATQKAADEARRSDRRRWWAWIASATAALAALVTAFEAIYHATGH